MSDTNKKQDCPHCKVMETLGPPQSNREYWLMTEFFVYFHGGADHCEGKANKDKIMNIGEGIKC